MSSLLSVVICTHDREELLAQTLASLADLSPTDGLDLEVVVVLSACTDRSEEVVETWSRSSRCPVRWILEDCPGLGLARNRGVEEARGEWVAFLDDDVALDPSWAEGLAEAAARDAEIVAGRVGLWWQAVERPAWMVPRAERLLSFLERGDEIAELEPPGALIGANFAVHRRVFERVGTFATDLGRIGERLLSGEDTELVLRAVRSGSHVLYAPRMSLRHWVAPERVSIRYLSDVAFGRGLARCALLRREGGRVPLRAMLVAIKQVVVGTLGSWWARARRDRARLLDRRLVAMRGLGLLRGLLSPRSVGS